MLDRQDMVWSESDGCERPGLSPFTLSDPVTRQAGGSLVPRRGAVYDLPDYAGEMVAFHLAFGSELMALVESLPLESSSPGPRLRILDVGCGDGFYTELFAERLVSPGTIVGLDANPAYLELARKRLECRRWSCNVDFVTGSLEQLPLSVGSFDFVWCAQSLFTLPEPVSALKQMAAAVRPGGLVAVLENDTLHQLLLPWPSDLELALRTAELEALSGLPGRGEKFYVARRLPAVVAAAGLEPLTFRTQAIDRQAPFDPNLKVFIKAHLDRLRERVNPYLEHSRAREFAELLDPENPASMTRQPFASLTWLNRLVCARRPCP